MAFVCPRPSLEEKIFETDSTTRETTPGCLRLVDFRVEGFRRVAVARFAVEVVLDELRGDFAADVRVAFLPLAVEGFDRPAVVLLPRTVDLERADVVLRDEDARAPVLLDPARDELLFPRELAVLFRDEPPPELFFAPVLRLVEPFFDEPPERLVEDLLDELEPVFFDELLLEPPDELFLEPLDFLEDDFEPDELELFLLLPLLLEPDEREPDDFLVVGIFVNPSNCFWYVPAPELVSNICAD